MSAAASPSDHAPPKPAGVSLPVLLLALAAGPAGWAAQLEAGYGLSSYACFPSNAALEQSPPPGWPHETALLLAINLTGLAVIVAGFLIAFLAWRRSGGEGRGGGRSRFLAACAMMSTVAFAVAALFDTVVIAATPTCWSL